MTEWRVRSRSGLAGMPRDSTQAKMGCGLEDHAFAAAEGTVVYGAVAVVGEGAEVVRGDLDCAGGDGAAEDAVIEHAGEEVREDGEDVEAHGGWLQCRTWGQGGSEQSFGFVSDGKSNTEIPAQKAGRNDGLGQIGMTDWATDLGMRDQNGPDSLIRASLGLLRWAIGAVDLGKAFGEVHVDGFGGGVE